MATTTRKRSLATVVHKHKPIPLPTTTALIKTENSAFAQPAKYVAGRRVTRCANCAKDFPEDKVTFELHLIVASADRRDGATGQTQTISNAEAISKLFNASSDDSPTTPRLGQLGYGLCLCLNCRNQLTELYKKFNLFTQLKDHRSSIALLISGHRSLSHSNSQQYSSSVPIVDRLTLSAVKRPSSLLEQIEFLTMLESQALLLNSSSTTVTIPAHRHRGRHCANCNNEIVASQTSVRGWKYFDQDKNNWLSVTVLQSVSKIFQISGADDVEVEFELCSTCGNRLGDLDKCFESFVLLSAPDSSLATSLGFAAAAAVGAAGAAGGTKTYVNVQVSSKGRGTKRRANDSDDNEEPAQVQKKKPCKGKKNGNGVVAVDPLLPTGTGSGLGLGQKDDFRGDDFDDDGGAEGGGGGWSPAALSDNWEQDEDDNEELIPSSRSRPVRKSAAAAASSNSSNPSKKGRNSCKSKSTKKTKILQGKIGKSTSKTKDPPPCVSSKSGSKAKSGEPGPRSRTRTRTSTSHPGKTGKAAKAKGPKAVCSTANASKNSKRANPSKVLRNSAVNKKVASPAAAEPDKDQEYGHGQAPDSDLDDAVDNPEEDVDFKPTEEELKRCLDEAKTTLTSIATKSTTNALTPNDNNNCKTGKTRERRTGRAKSKTPKKGAKCSTSKTGDGGVGVIKNIKSKVRIRRQKQEVQKKRERNKTPKIYTCPHESCGGRTFKLSGTYRYHRMWHEGLKPNACTVCPRAFIHRYQLTIHMRSHTGDKLFSCELCGKAFTRSTGLKAHALTHTGERPFMCEICGRAFRKAYELKRHVLHLHVNRDPEARASATATVSNLEHPATRAKLRTCEHPGCGQAFMTIAALRHHTLTHTGERPFTCDICAKSYLAAGSLKEHILSAHSNAKSSKSFVCDICQKPFARSGSLRIHRRTHSGLKPFPCEVCGKDFRTKTNRKTHMRTKHPDSAGSLTQNGEKSVPKKFHCETCGKSFCRGSLLIAHGFRVHPSGETPSPFKCDVCGRGFGRNNLLVQHSKVHTKEKPFVCPTCGKAFSQNANLKTHLKTHSEVKSHVCRVCGHAFTTKQQMQVHQRKHQR